MNKLKENTKPKKKIDKVKLWTTIVSSFTCLMVIMFIIGIAVIFIMLKDKPEIKVEDFKQNESSIIYDVDGNEIANLGTVIRQNIEYTDLPNCLVDAFVAVEDSRFFDHNGFDLPRFAKAMLENIKTLSFSQGGSTFTMQLVKNTYFVDDESGQEATRSGLSGVKRKVQEIALAIQLNSLLSKENVFTSYLNKLNYGGDYYIRGIQKAAQYYFAKNVKELNLVESAMLAGVVNAPNYYNPYYHLENAQSRTKQVLYLMKKHGYISNLEYENAINVNLANLLNKSYKGNREGEGIPYQAYIDEVLSEVYELTGLDPNTTTMKIYTYMNKGIQEQMDKIQRGDMNDVLKYPDPYFEVGSSVIENNTGAIVAILGGRNYANGGALLLNHATDQYKQPGSTMKPILDYSLAFENLGWATDHVLCDKPMFYDKSQGFIAYNSDGKFLGDVTLKQALGSSINTCAFQTLQSVLDKTSSEYVVNYLQTMGYKFKLDDFNIQYAIGGSTCEVTTLQQASAFAALLNYGVYNEPHTIKRIEFTNGKNPLEPTHASRTVLSDAAAYLTCDLLKSNVDNYGGTYDYLKKDYPVYGKTGTTDFGSLARQYGFPVGAINSGWIVAATSEYTSCTWVGYERIVKNQQSYISSDYYYNQRPQGKIAGLILDACKEYGKKEPSELTRPSTVSSITHILGTYPYAKVIDGMDESLITIGLIKTEDAKLVNLEAPKLNNMPSDFKISLDENLVLHLSWPTYKNNGDDSSTESYIDSENRTKLMQLKKPDGTLLIEATGKCLYDPSWIFGDNLYGADITINHNGQKTVKTIKSKSDSDSIELDLEAGDVIEASGYYCFEKGDEKSNVVNSEKITISTVVTIPPFNTTLNQLTAFASKYNFVTIKEESSIDKAGTFEATYNGTSVDPGTKINIKNNDDRIVITYYSSEEMTLTLAQSKIANNIKITAIVKNSSGDVTYNFIVPDGIPYIQNTNDSIYINKNDITEDITVEVIAASKNGSARKTITIRS